MQRMGPTRTNLNFTIVSWIDRAEVSLSKARERAHILSDSKKLVEGRTREGFEIIPVSTDTGSLKLNRILSKTLIVRYLKERDVSVTRWFRPLEGSSRSKLQLGRPAYFDAVDLVWFHPNIVLLRGNDRLTEEAYKKIASEIGLPRKLSSPGFGPYFLLWMFLEWMEGRRQIASQIELKDITSLKVIGIPELTGKEIAIEEAEKLLTSLPAMTALLDGLGLSELKGTFLLDGEFYISARVRSNGGLWVYVSDYLRRGSLIDDRLAASTLLVQNLFSALGRWRSLPKNQRRPSEQKYRELASRAQELLDERIREGEGIRRAAQRRAQRRSRSRGTP